MDGLLRHALVWGLGLSVYLGLAFVALLRVNAEMWLDDYPPDIRERHGPMSSETRRQHLWLGLPVLGLAFALILAASIHLVRTSPLQIGFGAMFLHTFVLLMVFNVVDLVIIDWLLFVTIQPEFVVLPGTKGMPGYSDYRFHWRAFLKGTLGILIVSVVFGLAALARMAM